MGANVIPRVFISYSWDSDEHRAWVRDLAARLRNDGIEAILDQWELAPGDQLTAFMERAVRESDFVLVTCTPKYRDRSDMRRGGVGYEGDVMTAEVLGLTSRRKFIPLLRHEKWSEAAPSWLLGSVYIDLTGHPYAEVNYCELVNTLHSRREKAPPVAEPATAGAKPVAASSEGRIPSRRQVEGVSADARRIIDNIEQEPRLWEVRFFAQVLSDELGAASSLRHELDFGVNFGPFEHVGDDAAIGWMRKRMNELDPIISGMTRLIDEGLNKAMGPPGSPGDPQAIAYVAKNFATAYKEAIRWTISWRQVRVSDRYQRLMKITPRLTEDIIPEFDAWAARIRESVRGAMLLDVDAANPITIEIVMKFTIPTNVQKDIMAELARLRGH